MTANPIQQFRDAIQSAGLIPPADIEPDGKLRRFSSNGKKADDAGWYLLHDDGIPAGSFGDWRTGIMQTWRADIGRTLTAGEEAAHRAKVEAMRRDPWAAFWLYLTLAMTDQPGRLTLTTWRHCAGLNR